MPDIMHNCCIKQYPNGSLEITASPSAVFREAGWEDASWKPAAKGSRVAAGGDPSENLERSIRRAKSRIRDYARSNDFTVFFTGTLDAGVIDRYDAAAVVRKLNRWLDNMVRRHDLIYVLIPERHKDGAIHFHGLMNDALEMVDSGTISLPGTKKPRRPRSERQRRQWLEDGGQIVYNLPQWKFGFTTAMRLRGDYEKAVAYVCKYIGKDMKNNGGKIAHRWYYSGGALRRPDIIAADCDFDAVAARFPGGCWGGADSLSFCRAFITESDVAGALAGLGVGTRTGGYISEEAHGSPVGG